MTRIRTIAFVVWLEMLRKKDVYVLLILLAALLLSLLSVDVFGLSKVTGYVKDMGLLFAWLFAWILAVVVSARELPLEEKQGTIHALLAKPVTRIELVLGKWLGAWSIVAAAALCFYAVVVAVVYLRGGLFRWDTLGQAYLLHLAALAMISSISLALSTRMGFDAAATFSFALTGGAFLIVPKAPELMLQEQGIRETALQVLYYALPHFELFDMRQRLVYDATAPVGWGVLLQVLAYGAVMTAVFLALAYVGYRRKRFPRGQML